LTRTPKTRRGALGALIAPAHLFLCGLLLIPAFLFQSHLALRAGQVVLFLVLAALSGRRIRVLPLVTVCAGILLANLLVPYGRVIAALGSFTVTDGALRAGLLKATTVAGLLYLSLFTIRADLPLPGRLGGLIGRVIYYFERILEAEKRFDHRDLVGSLDDLLLRVHRPDPVDAGEAPSPPARTTPLGYALLAALLTLNWAALLPWFQLLLPGAS
jgi:heptaprenyl diphosphate synthase